MMKLKCGNCNYEWNYQGNAQTWASCPRCKHNVRILNEDDNMKPEVFSEILDQINKKHECEKCGEMFDSQHSAVKHFKNQHIEIEDE